MVDGIALLLGVVGVLGVVQLGSLWVGWRNDAYFARELSAEPADHAPPAAVFLPCKGIDEQLSATLDALAAQEYPDYLVIAAVDSASDPAWPLLRARAAEAPERFRLVIAPPATQSSQKICNLLAAIATAPARVDVFAFLDSDAVPPRDWLRGMAAPLADVGIGAVTGFRWYVPGATAAGGLRCAWNAMALSLLGSHRMNFCWGGSMALRRETFAALGVAARWRDALAEDYEVTRAVWDAGLRVHFNPRAILPNHDEATWYSFWRFARRQVIITRVCHAPFWIAGSAYALLYALAWLGLAAGSAALVVSGVAQLAGIAAAAWLGLTLLVMAKALLRQRTLRRAGGLPGQSGFWADVLGSPVVPILNAGLALASGFSSRFWWRDTLYEMRSRHDIRICARHGRASPPSAPAEVAEIAAVE